MTGWGIDQLESLSKHLREATMPIATDTTCIRYEPLFYTNMLNGNKFCAGYSNGKIKFSIKIRHKKALFKLYIT